MQRALADTSVFTRLETARFHASRLPSSSGASPWWVCELDHVGAVTSDDDSLAGSA